MPWIPGEHRRGIRAVECVAAHLRGFEEDSRSEVVFWIDEWSIEFGYHWLMLLTFTTTHLLTSRPTLRSRSLCASWAPPLTGGLCGDLSPHRTTMTQTKCCPILHFGSWWGVLLQACSESTTVRTSILHPVLRADTFSHEVLLHLPVFFYGRRSGQPSSSSLARRACVHVLPFTGIGFPRARLLAQPEDRKRPWPLRGSRGDGNAVASSARLAFLRGAVCASTLYTRCCPFGICFPLVPVQ